MSHLPQLTSAIFTYTADEEITQDVLNNAYGTRPRIGPIARAFVLTEMHTRLVDGIHFLAMRFRPRQSVWNMRRLLEHIQLTGTIHMQPCVFPGLDRWLYMGTAQLYSPQGMILRNILREGDDNTHRHSYYHEPGMHVGHRMSVLHTGAIPRRGRVAGVAIVPAAAVASSPVPAPRRSPRLAAGSDSDSSDSDDDHRVPAAGSISIVYADDSDSSSSDEDMPDAVVEEVAEALAAEAEAVEEAEVAAPAAEEEAPAPAEADSPAPYRPSSPAYRPTSPVGMGGSAAEATPPVEDGPHHSRSTSAASAFSWTTDEIFRDINARLNRIEAAVRTLGGDV